MTARDVNRVEGMRRVDEACSLISSAVRLGRIDGDEVVKAVRAAISVGADMLADDIREEADRA